MIARGIRKRIPGEMNRTEQAYAAYLDVLKNVGEIAWYAYEPVKLRLARLTSYSPDFMVMLPDGELQFHEVKGFMREDAAVKLKISAEFFPFRFFLIRKNGSGWDITEIQP